MTDTRRKAQAMLNDARDAHVNPDDYLVGYTALCRAIEQHEAFRQEVNDAVENLLGEYPSNNLRRHLHQFIIRKPDPLVEVIEAARIDPKVASTQEYADKIRAALDARGLEIREKGQ